MPWHHRLNNGCYCGFRHVEKVADIFRSSGICSPLRTGRSRGLWSPEDLKIIGFDGTSAVRTAAAWLSTVVQPIDAMAQKAVELLVAQIDAEGGTLATMRSPASLNFPYPS